MDKNFTTECADEDKYLEEVDCHNYWIFQSGETFTVDNGVRGKVAE